MKMKNKTTFDFSMTASEFAHDFGGFHKLTLSIYDAKGQKIADINPANHFSIFPNLEAMGKKIINFNLGELKN